jgi:hypothetical protein
MWTLKIALLAVGVTVTAFAADSSTYSARCSSAAAGAGEAEPIPGNQAVADGERRECLARE